MTLIPITRRSFLLQPEESTFVQRASETDPSRVADDGNLYFLRKQLSKKHAELKFLDNKLQIRDLDSSFGTVINKEYLVPDRYYEIASGDTVGFIVHKSYEGIREVTRNVVYPEGSLIPLLEFGNPKVLLEFTVSYEQDDDCVTVVFDPKGSSTTDAYDCEVETFSLDLDVIIDDDSVAEIGHDDDEEDEEDEDEEEDEDDHEADNFSEDSGSDGPASGDELILRKPPKEDLDTAFLRQQDAAMIEYLSSLGQDVSDESSGGESSDYDVVDVYEDDNHLSVFYHRDYDSGSEEEDQDFDQEHSTFDRTIGDEDWEDELDEDFVDEEDQVYYVLTKPQEQVVQAPAPSWFKSIAKEVGKAAIHSALTVVALGVYSMRQ